MDQSERQRSSAMPILVDLVAMYIITGLLLILLAALLGRVDMSDAAVSIGIIATYIVSCFAGGFLIGKKKKKKIFMGPLCWRILFCGAAAWKSGGEPRAGRAAGTYADDSGALYFVRNGGRDAQLVKYLWNKKGSFGLLFYFVVRYAAAC